VEPQRRDIAELTRAITKLGLTLAKTNESIEKLITVLEKEDK